MELSFEKWIIFLKKVGLIISKTDSWKQKITGIAFRLFFIEIMLILQLIYLKEIKNLLDFIKLLSTLSTYVSYFVKAMNVIYQAKVIEELIEAIKTDLKDYELNEKFEKRIKEARKIFNMLWIAAFVTTFFGGFVPFFSHELAYSMWFPYDLNISILFWLSTSYQHIATVVGSFMDAILEMLPAFFMAYIAAMLEQLCDELENLKVQKDCAKGKAWQKRNTVVPSFNAKLIKIVKMHRNLLEGCKKFERIFNLTFFVRGLTSTIVFCTSAFSLIVAEDKSTTMRLITYIIPTFAQLIIPSYYGNEIAHLSDRLSTSLFNSEWYEEKNQKNVLIFVGLLKRKIKITTFKIFQVDLGTFMRVCNSAYSLYAVFKNIYHSR
jgi:hypothetical protein